MGALLPHRSRLAIATLRAASINGAVAAYARTSPKRRGKEYAQVPQSIGIGTSSSSQFSARCIEPRITP